MQATWNHSRRPANTALHKGFFTVRDIRKVKGKPHVTLVATTLSLMKRWEKTNVCAIDGGRKFNIMRYLVHPFGVVNVESSIGVCGIGVTSTAQACIPREELKGTLSRQILHNF